MGNFKQNNEKASFLERHPKLHTFIGIIMLALLATTGFLLVKWIIKIIISGVGWLVSAASHADAVIIVTVITGTVSILGIVISSIVAKIIDYKKARQDYLAKKREKAYTNFIDMLYKIVDSSKASNAYSTSDMIEDTKGFSKELTLWGSKRVVKKWVYYRSNAALLKEPTDSLSALEDIMNEMRKDMGVGKVKKWELVRFFINDLAEDGTVINKE